MIFDYFYGSEGEQFSFYRIPRLLIKDERFRKLSSDSKILYGLMLDRMSLSMKNGWIDEEGRAYIYFTVDDVMEELCCAKATAVKIMAELDVKKGIGLIEKKRQGLGRPDVIYVKNFTSVQDDSNRDDRELPEVQKLNFKKSKNQTSGVTEDEIQEVQNLNFKKSKNQTSSGSIIEHAEVQNPNRNYTENIYTEKNQTPSIYRDGRPNGFDPMDRYRDIIRENIAYEQFMSFGSVSERELVEELYQLICDVVCVPRDHIRIGGKDYPYEVVKARFLKLAQPHIEYVLEAMKQTTTKIRDIRSYLLTALYRAPDTINHYYQQEVNHDFYGEEVTA